MKRFLRFADLAALTGASLAAAFLILICLLLFAEIVTRALTGGTLGEVYEYATYSMSLCFLLGAAYTLRTGGHVRIKLLRFSNRCRDDIIELAASIVGLALAAFLALALTDLFWESAARGVTSATTARTPLAVPRAGLALGAWLLTLQLLARIVAVLAREEVERPEPGPGTMS